MGARIFEGVARLVERVTNALMPLVWKGWWKAYYKNPLVLDNLKRRRQPQLAYSNLPKITLSAQDETGKTNIPVLGQQSYTDRRPVIKSSLANTPCAYLGVDGILEKLNATLGTSHTLEIPYKSLGPALKSYIERNDDFGTAYAHIRHYWNGLANFSDIDEAARNFNDQDSDMRHKMLANNQITDGDAPPRRVWDLYANRVVPYWVARKHPWAISHAWMDEEKLKEGEDAMTPINGKRWPVPMPKDANLDLIRIEMLNEGAEYVWLDVLCLRQKGQEEEEDLRDKEWKVDLPTIGWVYHRAEKVVCYFSGLGLPLSFKPGDFESSRCWFNRAWTLQEMTMDPIIGGRTHDGDIMEEGLPAKFHEQLTSLRRMRRDDSVFDILSQMQPRQSTNLVDKVAGLVYLLYSECIPIYDKNQSEEDAWTALINVTQDWFRADLFFLYPEPGDGNSYWRPSWNQVMTLTETLPSHGMSRLMAGVKVEYAATEYEGPCIVSAKVRGLNNAPSTNKKPRHGEFVVGVSDRFGVDPSEQRWLDEHPFPIVANHAYSIPDGSYMLIGNIVSDSSESLSLSERSHWVVGEYLGNDVFRKISVFRLAEDLRERWLEKFVEHRKIRLL